MKRFEFFVFFFRVKGTSSVNARCTESKMQVFPTPKSSPGAEHTSKNKQTMETKGNTRKHATTQKKASSLGILYQCVIMSCNKM